MLNAAQEQFGGANPYQSAGSGTAGNAGQGGQQSNASGETAAPVPNPRGGGGGGGSGSTTDEKKGSTSSDTEEGEIKENSKKDEVIEASF